MKHYTHPKRKMTLIQLKDGRTYRKKWVYFRFLLRTENDEKSWSEQTSSLASQSNSVSVSVSKQTTHLFLQFFNVLI